MSLGEVLLKILDQLFFVRELIQLCIEILVVVSFKFVIQLGLLHTQSRIFLQIFLFVPHKLTLFVKLGSLSNSLCRLVQPILHTRQKLEVLTILVISSLKFLYFTIVFDCSSYEIASYIFDDCLVVIWLVILAILDQID